MWDVEQAAARETLAGHAGQITGLRFSPDGRTLYSSGSDGKVLIWDLAGDRRLVRPFSTASDDGRTFLALSYDLSPNGRVLAVGHDDGSVTLSDVETLREIATFPVVPRGPAAYVAFVPRSRTLIVSGEDFLAGVDTGEGHRVTPLTGHLGAVLGPTTVSADGRRMATFADGVVMLWTLESGRPVGPPRRYSRSGFQDVSLSPDGRTLARLLPGVGIKLADVATLRDHALLADSEDAQHWVRFTEDGRHIVAALRGGWLRIWSAETARPVGTFYAGGPEALLWPSVSPDGRTLATGSIDGTVRLFDVQSRRPLGAPLPGLPNRPVVPVFTPDGAHLLAVPITGPAYRWDVRPSSWARQACAVAGRTLTRAEWADVLPGRDYAPACG